MPVAPVDSFGSLPAAPIAFPEVAFPEVPKAPPELKRKPAAVQRTFHFAHSEGRKLRGVRKLRFPARIPRSELSNGLRRLIEHFPVVKPKSSKG
jgi:hypothetical protein